jgi:hypothetical protein
MKPMFKPPGTKLLKLKCDILLSSFAFKFNLRRYTLRAANAALEDRTDAVSDRASTNQRRLAVFERMEPIFERVAQWQGLTLNQFYVSSLMFQVLTIKTLQSNPAFRPPNPKP